jgi:phosphodiesterase/alkaline phosphatase D-like protein
VITWQSDVAADSQVEHGMAIPGYGCATPVDKRMTKQHRMTLTGLRPATRYYFRVKSKAADGHLMVSGDFRFKTRGATGEKP